MDFIKKKIYVKKPNLQIANIQQVNLHAMNVKMVIGQQVKEIKMII